MTVRATTLLEVSANGVHYTGADMSWCFEEATTTTDPVRAAFAAAGVLRGIMDTPIMERYDPAYPEAFSWASDLLLRACSSDDIGDVAGIGDFAASLPPIDAQIDDMSLAATYKNRPAELAERIQETVGTDSNILLIGIGHGGTIPAASTFNALSGEGNVFYPVRFSRDKKKDRDPYLCGSELQSLEKIATTHTPVIVDEDRATGGTMQDATHFFHDNLHRRITGVTTCDSSDLIFDPRFSQVPAPVNR